MKPKLYAASTCVWCRKTRQLLENNDVDFEYVYIDLMDEDEQQNVLDELAQYNPDCTVPTLVVGDEVVVGYEPERIRNALKLN